MPSETLIGKFFLLGAISLLCSIIVFPLHLTERLPYSMTPSTPIAFFMCVFAIGVRGVAVLRWTKFDSVLAIWIVLTIISQVSSAYSLNRFVNEQDVTTVIIGYFNYWLVFRAFYAFGIINPRFATKSVILALFGLLSLTCLIGILQSIGPVQQQMVDLAYRIGAGQEQIKLGASEFTGVRTTSVFSGPNIFGFINLVGCCLIVGWGIASGARLREWHAMVTVGALGLFTYANLNSQSRSSFVLAVLLTLVYIIFLVRVRKWRALFLAGSMVLAGAIAIVALTQSGQYEYMTKIFKTGVTADESYLVRSRGLAQFLHVANDLSLIGVGQDYFSVQAIGRGDLYSKANGTGDNGWAMAYFLLGLPGVIHLIWLNITAFKAVKQLRTDKEIFISWLRAIGGLFIALYLLTSPFMIRYHKFETFAYFLIVFGVIFAVLDIQKQRDRREHMAAMAEQPAA